MDYYILMAIMATAKLGENADFPTTAFVNPTLPPISDPRKGGYTVDIAQARNATENAATTALLTAIEADFEGAQATHLKIDATLSTIAALIVQTTNALNDGDDTSIYLTGSDVWRCRVTFEYE